MTELLTTLLQTLDADAGRRATLERYYSGTQPLAYLSPEARAAIGTRLNNVSTNLARAAVNGISERLRVVGFGGADGAAAWTEWQTNAMSESAPVAHREALILGESYALVWANRAGGSLVTIESPTQVSVVRDPATRDVGAACKRWEALNCTWAQVFEPDRITTYRADSLGATTQGFFQVAEQPNPLGMVPVVPIRNTDRLLGLPLSELDDLVPLVDALNKVLTDLMVASEYSGRPRRWATGVELVEDAAGNPVNPYPDTNRMMIAEAAEARFGQLDAADLAGYESAVRVIQAQISAVTGLPPHYLGVYGDQPASADALRAAEAALVAKVEARQASFGRAWEQVARLAVGITRGADPASVEVTTTWADAATRSMAQEADAVVKLVQAGILPVSYALSRLGYSDDEVAKIETARRADALQTAGTNLANLLPKVAS